ncbi:MAG: hypothetical protein P1V20_06615 [Verrucomicrobiales bacterium]|nr:hypothetical protein [Verrucomicrobiales bacterium]
MEILSPLFDRDPEEWRPWLLFFSGLFCLSAFGTVLWWLLSYDRKSEQGGSGEDIKKWGYAENSGNGSASHTDSEQNGEWGFSKKQPVAEAEETPAADDGGQSWPRIPTEAEIGARAAMLAQWREERGIAASQEADWMLAERELYMKECDLRPLPDREEFYRSGRSSGGFEGVSETAVNELSRLGLTDAASAAALSDSDKEQIRKWFSGRNIDLDLDSLAG